MCSWPAEGNMNEVFDVTVILKQFKKRHAKYLSFEIGMVC